MTTPISNIEILNSFDNLLPYLPSFFDDDVSFAITNKTTYLKVQNSSSLKLKISEGDPIPEGGAIFECIKTGKILIKDVPEHVYGIPFKSYAIPVKDQDGHIAGAIVLGKSIAKRTEVLSLSQSLSEALKQISISINTLSSGVRNVVDMNHEITEKVLEANESTKDTNGILKFVQSISSQTNLLGLNASIEAARAGESGRGFNVVAKEIRNLSTSTSESIKKVDTVLKNIEASIQTITNKIGQSTSIFQDQATTLEEIAISVEELNSKAQLLELLSKKI